MTTVTKNYKTKSEAKQALKKVFGVGPYSENGTFAKVGFFYGKVNDDNSVELSSDYWTKDSLENAFEEGIDSL